MVLLVSVLVLVSRLLKLWLSTRNVFNMLVLLQEQPLDRASMYTVLLVCAYGVGRKLIEFVVGPMSRPERNMCITELFGIGFDIFAVIIISDQVRKESATVVPVLAGVLCLRFFILCVRQRVRSFSVRANPPTPKEHQRVLMAQLLTILFILRQGAALIGSSLPTHAVMMAFTQLCHALLDTVLDLIKHAVFIGDREMLGNSQESFRIMMKVEFAIAVVNLAVDFVHFSLLLWFGDMVVSVLRSLSDCFKELKAKINTYKSWSKVHNFILTQLPKPRPEDLERENICIICRLQMDIETAKRLPCGHCLHADCLERWIGEQRKCPLCQTDLEQYIKDAERKQKEEELRRVQIRIRVHRARMNPEGEPNIGQRPNVAPRQVQEFKFDDLLDGTDDP